MTKRQFAILCGLAAALGACSREVPVTPGAAAGAFSLVSDSFTANADIPAEFTCDGKNAQPALRWSNLPAGTMSLALVVRDPDAPSGDFLHWAVVEIPPGVSGFGPGARPAAGRELKNDAGVTGYTGPCPPSGKHRYVFTLYALDAESYGGGQARPEAYLDSRALGKAVLTGLYQRKK